MHTTPFPSSRLYHVMGEGWYFEARGGPCGPYLLRAEAERELAQLTQSGPPRSSVWSDAERQAARLNLDQPQDRFAPSMS